MKINLVKLPKAIHFLLLLSFIFPHLSSFCQDFSYPNVHVKTVSFTGGETIKHDDYYNSGANYTAPQWLSSNTTQSPVAYRSATAPTVSATFTLSCPNLPTSGVYIRGNSPSDTNTFAAHPATIVDSTFTYPATTGSKVFASGVIRFFNPYIIKWEISFDAGITWNAIDSTNNRLYVTKGTPTIGGGDACNYETVFYLSCMRANYQTADTAIISHTWQGFTTQITLNYEGDSIYYYKDWGCPNVTLETLLCYRDGECYTWAYLFLSLLKVQGIALTNNFVYLDGTYNFLVKNYSFSSMISPNVYATATDLPGVPGQCTTNPASDFNNHGIALVNGVYYDPSYGVKYGTSLSAIPAMAFAAWDGPHYYTDLSVGTLFQSLTTY